jgi:hypothetical protein
MVGRARVLENRVFVELGMRGGEVAAVKIEVILLLAVIGERLAGDLPSSNTSTVREYRKKSVFTEARSWSTSRTVSVPSSTNETAPTWMPIILEDAAVCPGAGIAKAALAPAAIFRNSRRFTSALDMDCSYCS